MTITQTTQSTGSRAARRIALAGGAAAIAAVAFSGAASAAPPVVSGPHTINGPFGGSTSRTTISQINIPRPGNPNTHVVFGVNNTRSVTTPGGTTRSLGGGFVVDINPARPLFGSTVGISTVATSNVGGLHGVALTLGVRNGRIAPPVQTFP